LQELLGRSRGIDMALSNSVKKYVERRRRESPRINRLYLIEEKKLEKRIRSGVLIPPKGKHKARRFVQEKAEEEVAATLALEVLQKAAAAQ